MAESKVLRNLRRILLGLVLLTAFLLRYELITQKGFWVDEMFDASFIRKPLDITFIEAQKAYGTPLHMCLAKVAWILQPSELGLRLPDLALGLLSICLFYRMVARWLRNKWVGLLGALLLSLCPFHIHYSIDLRPFMAAIAFSLLIAMTFERALSKKQPLLLLPFLLFSSLGLYNMLSAGFTLAACGGWMVVEIFREWRKRRKSGPITLYNFPPVIYLGAVVAMFLLLVQITEMNLRPQFQGSGDPPPTNIWLALLGTWQVWLGGGFDSFNPQDTIWFMCVAGVFFFLGVVFFPRIRAWPLVLLALLTSIYVIHAFMRGAHYYASRFYAAQYPFFILVVLNGGLESYRLLCRLLERKRWLSFIKTPLLHFLMFPLGVVLIVIGYYPGLMRFEGYGKRVPPSFREDTEFLDINARENETIYLSTDMNYPLAYFNIYFRYHAPKVLHRLFADAGKSRPFWVYTFGQKFLEKHPELAQLPCYKVRLVFIPVGAYLPAEAYYFYKDDLNELDWLLSLKPSSAAAYIMQQILERKRFDLFVNYLGEAETMSSWPLSDMLRKVSSAYREAKKDDKTTQTLSVIIRGLLRPLEQRRDYPWQVIEGYLTLGDTEKALRFGNRQLAANWKNSNYLWCMAHAEAQAGNLSKAMDYYWITVRRGLAKTSVPWLCSEVYGLVSKDPNLARRYDPMLLTIDRLLMDIYRESWEAGKTDKSLPSVIRSLAARHPEFREEYRDFLEKVAEYEKQNK